MLWAVMLFTGQEANAWVCSIKLALMAFSFTACPAFLEGQTFSQADCVTAVPTQNANTTACSGVLFPATPL